MVIAMGLATAACGATSTVPRSATTAKFAGAILAHALPKPEIILTDTDSKPYNLRPETEGKVTLLYFGYTHCPDVCPVNMAALAAALRQLPATFDNKITVVFVTTDPARDTPTRLRTWLNQFDPKFVGLTGSAIQIASAQMEAGLWVATKESDGQGGYGVNHAAFTLVYTRDNLAHLAFPSGLPIAAQASDLRILVTRGWS